MKGPSLDAIRKFKEQQERKKLEEQEQRVKEKVSTLEHRAAQGDRKAKIELRKIEKIEEERQRAPEKQVKSAKVQQPKPTTAVPKRSTSTVKSTTNFADLMKLAQQNNNQIKAPPKVIESAPINKIPKLKAPRNNLDKTTPAKTVGVVKNTAIDPPIRPAQSQLNRPSSSAIKCSRPPIPSGTHRLAPNNRLPYRDPRDAFSRGNGRFDDPRRYHRPPAREERYYDDYEDEDEYESDFVVDEDDDDVQNEVSRTISSVFKYDKRRCDLRERELDIQYRAIGKVSTFEDLEREERRASRLAAAEDARELKEEEERKRRKKIRLGRRYNDDEDSD